MANENVLEITLEIEDSGANAKLSGFEQRLKNTDKTINATGKDNFAKGFSTDLIAAENRVASFHGKLISMGLQAVSLGAAYGVASRGFQIAIDKTIEAQKANRLLAASALEAGLAYDVLAEKNRKFAGLVGLSDVAAAQTTAKIAQLATVSGRTDQIDKIQKSFADLAAARGLDASKLETIASQIISGSDEGLNSLGLANPSVLYKQYADSVNRSVDSLTDLEQAQIRLDAVLNKSAVFDGSAEIRMNSLEGQVAKTALSYENFTSNLSQAATGNIYFQNSLDLINKGLLNMSLNLDEVRNKLKRGLTPEQIAKEELGTLENRFLGGLSAVGNSVFGLGAVPSDIYNDGFLTAINKYTAGVNPKYAREQLERQRAEQIRNQQKLFENQDKDAVEQNALGLKKTFNESFQGQIDALLKPSSEGFGKITATYDQILKIQKDFYANFSKLDDSQREIAQKKIDTLRSIYYVGKTDEELKSFSRNPDFKDAKFNLTALDTIKQYLPEDKYLNAFDKFNDFIEKDFEKANQKIKEIEKSSLDVFDGLFQKTGANNPIVVAFNEGDKAFKMMRESLRGLSPEVQAIALEMQKKLNFGALFDARLTNSLNILDLRESAANFRNPFDPKKLEAEQQKYIESFLRNNPNYLNLNRGKSESFLRNDILSRGEYSGAFDTPQSRLNKSLQAKVNEIYKPNLTADQLAKTDKQFIALTQGVNPLELNSKLREESALAREREANRKEKFDVDNLDLQRKKLQAQEKANKHIERLIQLAEKGGSKAVEITINDQTNGGKGGGVDVTKAPTAADTEAQYNGGMNFGYGGGFSNR